MYPKIPGHVTWPKDHNKTLIMEMRLNFLAMHVTNESLLINKRLTGVHHAINQMQCPEPMFIFYFCLLFSTLLFCYYVLLSYLIIVLIYLAHAM